MYCGALVTGATATLVALLLFSVQEIQLELEPAGLAFRSGDIAGRREILAPVITGKLLSIFAWIATETPLRPFIVRYLMNQNGIHEVRQLASRLGTAPLHFPMYSLNVSEQATYLDHANSAENLRAAQLVEGIFKRAPYTSNQGSRYRTALDYHKLYASKKATPTEVFEKVLQGCEELEYLHMFSSLEPDLVRAQAAASTKRWEAGKPLGPLDGVPVVVKDMVDVKGHIIYEGTAVGTKAEKDGVMIQRIKGAGGIILGVTVMTEGGVTPLGYNVHFKGPLNPHDVNRYPGGSSSGSAVVVAAGLAPIGIGFDGGGSIRIPSAMSGVFGLAVGLGRIPFDLHALPSTLVKAGPMTASALDLLISYQILAQPPPEKHFYRKLYGVGEFPPVRTDKVLETDDLSDVRIGVCWDLLDDADTDNLFVANKALNVLVERGATIVNITLPHLSAFQMSHALLILAEFAQTFDVKFAHQSVSNLEPNTRISVALGRTISAIESIAANKLRGWAMTYVKEEVFNKVDYIFTHTVPVETPPITAAAKASGENNNPLLARLLRNIFLANWLGLPAMNVPVGYGAGGKLPVGVQLVGDHWMEHKLLRTAVVLEEAFQKDRKRPSIFFDPLASFD